jgi:hypothetical protein
MREVDSRLSQISQSRTDVQRLDFGGGDSQVTVRDGSAMNITVNRNAVCRVSLPMGSIRKEASDGGTVAYEGGGVWRRTDGGTVMVSPPDFQYRNGTIDFPVTQVDGSVSGTGTRLRASYNRTASHEATKQLRQTFGKPECRPENVTLVVHSDNYEAWGRFLQRKTGVPDANVTYFSNESVKVYLSRIGGDVNPVLSGKQITASSEYVATIKILAMEASVVRNWDVDGDSNDENANLNDPMEFAVLIDGTTKTPFGDGDPNDANVLYEDDLNDPRKNSRLPITATVTGDSSTSFEVQTTMTECGDSGAGHGEESHWTWDGVTHTGYSASPDTYHDLRCSWADVEQPDNVRVVVNSGSSSSNFILLEDGDKVPGYEAVNDAQKTLQDVLGPRLDANKRLRLDDNQAVYVYDISGTSGDADCDNDGVPGYDADGDGFVDDPNDDSGTNCDDFNDAIVLIELNQPGTVNAHSDFVLSISAKRVQIDRA